MFGKKLKMIAMLCMSLIMFFSIGGVYATWKYAGTETLSVEEDLIINAFTWTGAELLPSESESGLNHLSLIENLISDLNKGNRSEAHDLMDARWDRSPRRNTFGNMAVTGGGTLTEVIGAKNTNVDFLIYFPDGVGTSYTYQVFTTSVDLGHRGEANFWGTSNKTPGVHFYWDGTSGGTKHRIFEVYRTIMKYNSTLQTWEAVSTDLGSTLPCWYDENKSNANKNITQIPSFDPTSFETIEQTPIATVENPAFMYINYTADHGYEGETVYVCPKNWIEEKWFYLAPEMASGVTKGTVTLTLQPECKDCSLDVFTSTAGTDDVLLASNDGSGTVKFTAMQGTTYYIRTKGAYTIVFTSAFTAKP